MKKLSLLLLAIVFGINVIAQKITTATIQSSNIYDQALCSSGPNVNFLIHLNCDLGYRDYLVINVESTSTSMSYVQEGSFGVIINYNAFLNVVPCFTLGNITISVDAYHSTGVCYKETTLSFNSIFYYDYPLDINFRIKEYTIPEYKWSCTMTPTSDTGTL
jgi:hypothetical protein